MARIGVVGAGRVGAVLSAALRAAGHEIVAAAGDSAASLHRIETLLPGVRSPSRPTSPAPATCCCSPCPTTCWATSSPRSSAPARSARARSSCHTSGRHGLAVLEPATAVGARPIAMHPAMTFTGTELDLDRLTGCVFGMTAGDAEREYAEGLVADLGGIPLWVPESKRTLYHAGLAHGANHLVTLVSQAMELLAASGAEDPAATLRPLLSAALDNALASGRRRPDRARSCAATYAPCRPTSTTSPRTRRPRSRRTSPWRRPPPTGPCSTAGCCRSAPPASSRMLDEALVRVGETGPVRGRPCADRDAGATRDDRTARPRAQSRGAAPLPWRLAEAGARVGARAHDGRAARGPRRADGPGPRGGRRRTPRWSPRSSSTRCSSRPGRTSTATRAPSTPTSRSAPSTASTSSSRPSVEEVYPGGDPQVTVDPGPLGAVLEGARPARPTSAAC